MTSESSTSGPTAQVAAAGNKTVSQIIGEITWLLTQSPIHKQLFIGDLEWFVMPAILLEQFRVFSGPQHPVAVALWANVSEDTEQRLEAGGYKLRPDEWRGGDRRWLIEIVAPYGGNDEILADLSASVFSGQPFKYHRVNEAGQREVAEYTSAPEERH
jgi:cytolysin-activating lysine-acyltransferase